MIRLLITIVTLSLTVMGANAVWACQSKKQEHVTLINVFQVDAEKVDETIAWWTKARNFLVKQPGYIETKLHRSLDEKSDFLLINIAKWKSEQHFNQAIRKMHQQHILPKIEGVEGHPALYQVVAH